MLFTTMFCWKTPALDFGQPSFRQQTQLLVTHFVVANTILKSKETCEFH